MGDFIRQYHSVDVSVAVQTPSGLMVPVVRNTDRLGLQDINAAVKKLAGKVIRLSAASIVTETRCQGGTAPPAQEAGRAGHHNAVKKLAGKVW